MVASLQRNTRHELLANRWNELRLQARTYTALDMAKTARAVESLYESIGLAPPMIFWCKSPLQILLMPTALQFVLRSDNLWKRLDVVGDYASSPLWRQLWVNLANHLADSPLPNAPLRGTTKQFWTTQDNLLEDHIKAMSDQHVIYYDTLLEDNFGILWDHFHNKIRKETQSLVVPHINSFMLRGEEVERGPEELAQHLTKLEEAEMIVSLFSHIPTVQETARVRAPWRTLRRAVRPMVARTHDIWWGPLAPAPSEWDMIFHCLLNDLFVPASTHEKCAQFFRAWMTIMQQSLCSMFYTDAAFICERRDISVDDRGLLHNEAAPSLSCGDGFQLYSWHGVTVPAPVITNPGSLTVSQIDQERNLEVKRIMLERFGAGRYLDETGATIIHRDSYGTLYSKEMHNLEPLIMVKVLNRTPEADGTYKEYFLRVPPEIITAKEAVAWTFGLQSDEYHPKKET